MSKLKIRMEEWAVCYRKNLQIHGQNTNNIVEASIRIFKDIVLERCKAFNAAALVDFVFDVLENYHKRRLIKFSSYRVSKPELLYKSFCTKAHDLIVSQIDELSFNVTSSVDNNNRYTVFIKNDYEFCDCPAGQCGSFCKHICAVHLNGYATMNCPVLTTTDRIKLGLLAVG